MKLYFICKNITGFDMEIRSLDGYFKRTVYLPRGRHAVMVDVFGNLYDGFELIMKKHDKKDPKAREIRKVPLKNIDYTFYYETHESRVGPFKALGEFPYKTVVNHVPDDVTDIYIRFEHFKGTGGCVPKCVCAKTRYEKRIKYFKFDQIHKRVMLSAETVEKGVKSAKRKGRRAGIFGLLFALLVVGFCFVPKLSEAFMRIVGIGIDEDMAVLAAGFFMILSVMLVIAFLGSAVDNLEGNGIGILDKMQNYPEVPADGSCYDIFSNIL